MFTRLRIFMHIYILESILQKTEFRMKEKSFHEWHRKQYVLSRNILYFCHLYFHPYSEFTPLSVVHHCKETTPCTSLPLLSIFSFFHSSKLASLRLAVTSPRRLPLISHRRGESTTSRESDALRKVSNRSRGEKTERRQRQVGTL